MKFRTRTVTRDKKEDYVMIRGSVHQEGTTESVSCPVMSDSLPCSLLGSSVHGILQARILELPGIKKNIT